MKKIFLSLFILLLLSGCMVLKQEKPKQVAIEKKAVMAEIRNYTPADIEYLKEDYTLSLYEPENGAYLGAYILADKTIDYSLEEFEKLTEKPHSLYVYNYDISKEFPVKWLLENVSNFKTPYFNLNIKMDMKEINRELLVEKAKAFSQIYAPVFLELPPFDKNDDEEVYKEAFKSIKDVFDTYATNVAFVYAVSYKNVNESEKYYPGDDYVEWVAIHMIKSRKDVLTDEFDNFYEKFQQRKPIMVSRYAVSHLNKQDFIYKTDEACLEVVNFYNKLQGEYKRVKGVIYYDFNAMDFNKDDDFTITTDTKILSAYQNAIKEPYFLKSIDIDSFGDYVDQFYKSKYKAFKSNNQIFISENCLIEELNIKDFSNLEEVTIDGKKYYNVTDKKNIIDKIEL